MKPKSTAVSGKILVVSQEVVNDSFKELAKNVINKDAFVKAVAPERLEDELERGADALVVILTPELNGKVVEIVEKISKGWPKTSRYIVLGKKGENEGVVEFVEQIGDLKKGK